MDNIVDGIVAIHDDGRVARVNRAAVSMLGLEGGTVVGQPSRDVLDPVLADLAEACRPRGDDVLGAEPTLAGGRIDRARRIPF